MGLAWYVHFVSWHESGSLAHRHSDRLGVQVLLKSTFCSWICTHIYVYKQRGSQGCRCRHDGWLGYLRYRRDFFFFFFEWVLWSELASFELCSASPSPHPAAKLTPWPWADAWTTLKVSDVEKRSLQQEAGMFSKETLSKLLKSADSFVGR